MPVEQQQVSPSFTPLRNSDHQGIELQQMPDASGSRCCQSFGCVALEHLAVQWSILSLSITSHSFSSNTPILVSNSPSPFSFTYPTSVGLLSIVGWQVSQPKSEPLDTEAGMGAESIAGAPPALPRQNAVLVFGSTGRVGRRVVQRVRSA